MIICNKLPFVVSHNGKIYNFTGGSFKQLYVADPSKHKLLASLANSPSTFSSLLNSAFKLFRFNNKQTQSITTQIQPVIEASGSKTFNSNSNKNLNVSTDTIAEVNVSDFADINRNIVHGDICSTMLPHETCIKTASDMQC